VGPFGLTTTTAAASDPVSLGEAKARLRVVGTDEDADIAAIVAEATAQCEAECGRQFVTATLTLKLDGFPAGPDDAIRLPRPPAQSVTWIKYYDTDGTLQTIDSADYILASAGEPARVVPAVGSFWPATQVGRPEAVEVKYVAGYGGPSAVPRLAKAAILGLIVDRYRNRGDATDKAHANRPIPAAVRRLLDSLEFGEVR
jgi:uncharacterized phiE125 gp8 family phage protein